MAGDISKQIRDLMNWSQQQLADRLQVSRNYVALIETGAKTPSVRLLHQMEQLLTTVAKGSIDLPPSTKGANPYRKSGSLEDGRVEEAAPRLASMVDPRYQPRAAPSGQADVLRYFSAYCAAAEASGDPDAFPSIMRQLKKHFPLDEFSPPAPKPVSPP